MARASTGNAQNWPFIYAVIDPLVCPSAILVLQDTALVNAHQVTIQTRCECSCLVLSCEPARQTPSCSETALELQVAADILHRPMGLPDLTTTYGTARPG